MVFLGRCPGPRNHQTPVLGRGAGQVPRLAAAGAVFSVREQGRPAGSVTGFGAADPEEHYALHLRDEAGSRF